MSDTSINAVMSFRNIAGIIDESWISESLDDDGIVYTVVVFSNDLERN